MDTRKTWSVDSIRILPVLIALLFLLSLKALAEGNGAAADAAEEAARNSYIERFTKFTEDKNVMGRPKAPKGAKLTGGKKTRFDQDDGVTYQSDLTYHDFTFNTPEVDKADPTKSSTLFAFVSPHGGLTTAAGSSELERAVYNDHKKFIKAEEQGKDKKEDDKTGTRYESVFKVETQQVLAKGQGQNANNKNDKAEKDKVERSELREEVRPDVEKVGESSFETIRQAGRDKGFENDDSTLPNGVLLRYAAGEASQALWNSSLANLVQRRVNRGIRSGDFPDTPQLSEGAPSCGEWQKAAVAALNVIKDEARRKALQDEVNRMAKQCGQLTNIPYNAINPRFETNAKTQKEELQQGDINKEDGYARDERVQLETLAKAGRTANDVPSNWKYKDSDSRARITVGFDDNAKPEGEENMTVKEQLDSYNNQLEEASKGYQEVQSRMPTVKVDSQAPLAYEIQPNTKSVMEINQPSANQLEDMGVILQPPNAPKTYDQMVQQNQK